MSYPDTLTRLQGEVARLQDARMEEARERDRLRSHLVERDSIIAEMVAQIEKLKQDGKHYRENMEGDVAGIIRETYEKYLRTPEIETFHDVAAKEIVATLFPEKSAPVFQAPQNNAEMLPKREPAGSGADTPSHIPHVSGADHGQQ